MACPNVNLDSWKNLVAARGENVAYALWDKYDGNVPQNEYQPDNFFQLTSKETEEANKQLNTYLSDFLKPFGVQVRDFEEYKKRTGQDGLGATDVLNKLIYLSSQAKIDTMPEEAAHMAIMLMGEKHPDINFLLENIEYWSEYEGIKKEYSEKYKGNQKMIKLEAIAKLISGSIVNKYKETGGDKKLIEKALAFINSFFQKIREMFLKKNAFYNPMGYGVHLADKIAINMLAGNTNYIANLENSKKALSYDEALENNPFAKSIIDRYTKGRYNFKLVGSLAIAGQGENIYRPSEEPIHDLDFIVSNIEDYNDLVNHMSDIGAERVHNGWANKSKGYTTYAYYIPAPGHRIDVISRDRRGWVSEYKLFDPNGKEVKPNANNIMATDFFVYYDKPFEESVGIFSSWQDIYNGKLGLSRAEGAERLFQREKDQRDYVLSQPVSREKQLEEFTYLQKEDKYSYANLLRELSNDLKESLLYNNKLNYEVTINMAGQKASFPHMWVDENTGKLKKNYQSISSTIRPDKASLNLYSIYKFNKRYDDLKPKDQIDISSDVFEYLNHIVGSSISLENYNEIKDLENKIARRQQYYSDSLKDINEISIAGEDVFYYKVKDQWYKTNEADENTKTKGVPVKESEILLERDKELKKYKEDLDKLLKDASITGKSQFLKKTEGNETAINLQIESNIHNKSFRSFFDNKNITDIVEGLDLPGGINLQKEQQSERPSNEELNKKIKKFLASIGVTASIVDEIRDREGNKLDAIAKADILNKVIEVVNGTADITTLPEEAAHFFVEMLGENHPLYRDMLGKITSYAIYKDTVDKYKDDKLYRNPDGTVNFNKLKKEAMGKLIMQHVIEQFDEEETAKRVEAAKSWWKKVWEYIKSIFNKGEKVNEQLDNPFATSAKKILESDASDLDKQFKSQEEYLQKSTTGEEAFNKAKALQSRITLDDTVDPKTGKKKHIYVRDGKQVVDPDGTPRSVNENVVKPWYKKKFPTDKRSDIQKVIDDLKAEYGTGLHKEIEKIIDRYIDKDTGLVREKAIAGDKLNVTPEIEKKLNTYIAGLIRSYPPGTRFMSEARIFNEKKNLPGTVDLIVFLKDGSADIYDWKSQEVADGETELKWFKEPAYRIQLEEYRQAIEQQFGVTKFNKIRAIPIRTMFKFAKLQGAFVPQDLKDIEIGPVDPSLVPESKEYLLPVVAEKESTGDVKLDKLISRLNTIYETLANKSTKEKDKKNIELAKLKKTIRNLQVKKDMKYFVESGLLEVNKYYNKLINNDIGISEILEARDIINVYGEGSTYLKSILIRLKKSILETTDVAEKASLEKLQDDYKTMALNAKDLVESLNERAKDLADEEASKNGIKGLLNPERVMDYLKRNFRSLSQLETTAAQAFYKIRNKAFQVRDIETEEMNEKLGTLKEELEKWAASKGIPKDKIFDGILEIGKDGKRTGDFLNIYSDEFMDLKKAAIKRGDTAWIRANTTFDAEAYKAAFVKYKDIVEGSTYSADPKLDREKKDAAILRWVEMHNGEKSDLAALLPKGNFLRPKDIWWSDKYKTLNKAENAPLKAVYDEFQSLLRSSEKAGMIDYEFGFIPSIMRTKMEGFVLGDMGKAFDKQAFLQSLAIDSSVDFGQLDINGKQIKKIPVYYTRDLGADKSFDLFKVFSIWGTHTANYKAMSSIEDTANLLLFVEQNKQSLQTNRFGKVKKGAEPVNNNQINADVLEKFINFYVYGQKLDAADDFSFKVGDTEISATRGLQKLLRYFSIKTLALNPISGTANLVGGTVNASFIAKKNLYFGDKEWAWGQYKLASRDEKALAFLDYAQVELENQAFYNSNQLSMSDVMKNWTSDKFFVIQRVGDKLVTYPVALAMFKSHMVDENGKIVSIRDYVKAKNNYEGIYNLPSAERKKVMDKIDKEIEDLSENSSLYAKSKKVNGKLEIEGVDRKSDTFIEFRNKIKKMNKSIIGNSSQEDINQFRIGMLGQMVMQFRSWIPGLVTERFGDLAYDTDMETYNYGKARVFFKHFFDKKFFPLLGELITGFGDNAIDRAKERYAEMVIRRREQGDENFEERMSEAQFIDMYIANLRSMTREMLVMLAFLSLLLWAHTVPPDEDKEHNGARKLMAKAMDKYYNEVAFFYNPTEFQSLIKSPIPITGLFTDIAHFGEHSIKEVWGLGTGDEKLVKKSHPMKYFNKMIPVAKQAQDIFALFDKEFRTTWGIKT